MSARAAEFDALYDGNPDPWRMETSAYEAAKYDATLGALPRARYRSGLEVGCSIGVLTARLAARCDRLVALDVSARAIERAAARPGCEAVAFRRAEVPNEWPDGAYDLIVLSEVLYFLEPDEVREIARLTARDLAPGGTVVAVNWLGECDRTLDGAAAADLFVTSLDAAFRTRTTVAEQYRIDVAVRD